MYIYIKAKYSVRVHFKNYLYIFPNHLFKIYYINNCLLFFTLWWQNVFCISNAF